MENNDNLLHTLLLYRSVNFPNYHSNHQSALFDKFLKSDLGLLGSARFWTSERI